MPEIELQDIYLARQRIAPYCRRTPLLDSPLLSLTTGTHVRLKLESLQFTGSFKARGATNKLLSLPEETRARGVITVSSGNHGRAVSYIAHKLGVHAVVCVPDCVPQNKQEAISDLGAELVVHGANQDEAMAFADRLQEQRGLTMIHPFDDPAVIAGQGTIGLELLDDDPEIDTILVPLSGGGLMSGIAFTLKHSRPSVRTIGVSMDRGPAMVESVRAGQLVDVVEEPTLADALAGGLNKDNRYTFEMVRKYVDDYVLVTEEEIARAMVVALQERFVVEGGGAVGIAALLSGKVKSLGRSVAAVISGGNVDLSLLMDVYQKQMAV
jgi:threonine dehydratase